MQINSFKRFSTQLLLTLGATILITPNPLLLADSHAQYQEKKEDKRKNTFFPKVKQIVKKHPIAFFTTMIGSLLLTGGVIISLTKNKQGKYTIKDDKNNNKTDSSKPLITNNNTDSSNIRISNKVKTDFSKFQTTNEDNTILSMNDKELNLENQNSSNGKMNISKVEELGNSKNLNFLKEAKKLFAVASYYHSQSENDRAIADYQQVVKIYEDVGNTNHETYGKALCELAWIYKKQKKYTKALEYAEKALKAYENLFNKEHEKYALPLNLIAKIYYSDCKYTKAIEYYQKALEKYKEKSNKTHKKIDLHRSIALSYRKLKKYPKAIGHYQDALKMQEKFASKEDPIYTEILKEIKEAYKEKNK